MLNKKITSPLIAKMLNDDCNWLIIGFFLYKGVCIVEIDMRNPFVSTCDIAQQPQIPTDSVFILS